jgi:hypothetical protein
MVGIGVEPTDRIVGIGFESMDGSYDSYSMFSEPLKVMYFAASENAESYEEYTESPERYHCIIKNWNDPSAS